MTAHNIQGIPFRVWERVFRVEGLSIYHVPNLNKWCRPSLYPERFKRDGNAAEEVAELPLVRFADVGCGFGGLLIRLAPLYPDKLMVGFELRDKVRTPF